jgi:hypothetical protein
VAANGVGCDILHSADGGVTWAGTTAEPFALLLLDIAATNANVVALGALTLEYSLNNASTFNSSLAPFGAGQCIRPVGAPGSAPGGLNSFAAIGDWGLLSESNGPAISTDSGAAFSADHVTGLSADARYGSFPSAKVWYIAAGDWPGEGSDDSGEDTRDRRKTGSHRNAQTQRQGDQKHDHAQTFMNVVKPEFQYLIRRLEIADPDPGRDYQTEQQYRGRPVQKPGTAPITHRRKHGQGQ